MKTNSERNSNKTHQERIMEIALRTRGNLFPETIDEVKEFERKFGRTEIILPTDLLEPDFLNSKSNKNKKSKNKTQHSEKLAMAARSGIHKLPEEVLKQMFLDRKKADAKRKSKHR